MDKPERLSISRIWSASSFTPKSNRKISDLIFEDRISARRLILYVYTIQLYGYAIQIMLMVKELPPPSPARVEGPSE
jgi:hypothetical protein